MIPYLANLFTRSVQERATEFYQSYRHLHWKQCKRRWRFLGTMALITPLLNLVYLPFALLAPNFNPYRLPTFLALTCTLCLWCVYRMVDYAWLYTILVNDTASDGDEEAIREVEWLKRNGGVL